MVRRAIAYIVKLATENAAWGYVSQLPIWGKLVSVLLAAFTAGAAWAKDAPLHMVVVYLTVVALAVALTIHLAIDAWQKLPHHKTETGTDFRVSQSIGSVEIIASGRAERLLAINLQASGLPQSAPPVGASHSLKLDLTRPFIATADSFVEMLNLCWWHIQVLTLDQHMTPTPAKVFLRLGLDESYQEIPMVWSTDLGPQEEIVLRWSHAPRLVPIVVRANQGVQLSGDPHKLPHFALPPWTARITDAHALLYQKDFRDYVATVFAFRLIVRSTGTEDVSPMYTIVAGGPSVRNQDQNGFVMHQVFES